jgi:MraZ protein
MKSGRRSSRTNKSTDLDQLSQSHDSAVTRSKDHSQSSRRFRGRFEVKVDAKGRVSLPPSHRLSAHLVVTNHRFSGRNALHVYTLESWEALERRLERLSSLDAAVQAFARFYLSGGQVVEPDGQGRMLLPVGLRKFAQIESDAVLVGLGDKVEIWSQAAWESLFSEMTVDFDQTLARVADLDTTLKTLRVNEGDES